MTDRQHGQSVPLAEVLALLRTQDSFCPTWFWGEQASPFWLISTLLLIVFTPHHLIEYGLRLTYKLVTIGYRGITRTEKKACLKSRTGNRIYLIFMS